MFCGILSAGRLYFKTDTATRSRYVDQGMEPFRPRPKQTLKNYDAVPVDILEDHQQLALWARQAMACQPDTKTTPAAAPGKVRRREA